MIDQALNLLTMYIIWKTRDLTAAADPSPEEEKFRDQLKTRRDLLIERLLDFTVSTQSNTSEGVRRAVSLFVTLHHYSTLFILSWSGIPKPAEPSYTLLPGPDCGVRWQNTAHSSFSPSFR